MGIVLTFIGLYIYNDAKSSKSIAKAEEKMELDERRREMVLPTTARGAAWLSTVNEAKHTQSTSISLHGPSTNPIHSAPSHHVSFLHDPRRTIPSPPPSRGPSSDDESGVISGKLKDTSR